MESFSDESIISALRRRAETEPERPWASIPKDNNDLSKGFIDFSFRQLAAAVDRAARWLHAALGAEGQVQIQSIAYLGINDLTIPILSLAAAKTSTKLLLPFPLAATSVKKYLINAAGCEAVLHHVALADSVQQLLQDEPQIKSIPVPNYRDWLAEEAALSSGPEPEELDVLDRPWLVLHTSGTTGMPKLVTYSQRFMQASRLVDRTSSEHRIATSSFFLNVRFHTSIPFFHLCGIFMVLTCPILHRTHAVLGPNDRPPSPETIRNILKHGNIEGLLTTPALLKNLCDEAEGLALLRKQKFISWAGAGLDKSTGDVLCGHSTLAPSLGTTECGTYWTWTVEEPQDWAYYEFLPDHGIEFEQTVTDDLYELVIRKLSSDKWQQIFQIYPDLDVYRTSDLFKRHPTKQDLWLYAGRTDDIFKLSSGALVHYASRQQSIEENKFVETALLGGAGQMIPFLLINLAGSFSREHMSEIWETVLKDNNEHSQDVVVHEDMIILADPARPFKRTMKNTILRKETLALYQPEIEQRLSARGHSWVASD